MRKEYQITSKNGSRELAKFLAANSQVILPMVELIEQSQMVVDDFLEVLGRSTLEAVLAISAANVAGEAHRGRRGGEIVRHGVQDGIVSLSNRRMRVSRPRLPKRCGGTGGEVSIEAASLVWWKLRRTLQGDCCHIRRSSGQLLLGSKSVFSAVLTKLETIR